MFTEQGYGSSATSSCRTLLHCLLLTDTLASSSLQSCLLMLHLDHTIDLDRQLHRGRRSLLLSLRETTPTLLNRGD